MKKQNKILTLRSKLLLCLIAGFVAVFALGVRVYASSFTYASYSGTDFLFIKGNFTINCNDNYESISYVFDDPDNTVSFIFMVGKSVSFCHVDLSRDGIYLQRIFTPRQGGDVFIVETNGISYVDTPVNVNLDDYPNMPITNNYSTYIQKCLEYCLTDDFEEIVPPIEIPDLDSLESDYDFCLKGFSADNSILATWDGTVTDEYENEESFVVAYLGYAYKEQPAQIAVRELYNSKVLISDNQFYIPWDEVQHEDETLYLRYVEFVPYGRINPDKLFYPYIKGCSAYIYFSLDASGNIDSVKIPIKIDKDNLTTNIIGGTFDSSIPALSDVTRVDNGFVDPMSSYSQSSTVKWSTVFNDSDYYIQVRTTFRYKLNADKVWSEFTVDTSIPTGRFSCLVDAQSFTYTYGDYGPLFWKQDDSIWTDDDLDKQGNMQPIRDSIRIVHIDNGVVSYGPWTTFTLKNGIWQTGEVTGSYESDYLEEDNTGGSIVEEEEVNSNFLTDFDFSDISGVWDAFIGIFKNLFSFLGQFPDLFGRIFSFLPYEIRSMIYVSMVAICVLGLVKAVVK